MSLLKRLSCSAITNGPAVGGISNGDEPGHIGVWVVWKESHPTEVFRVVVKAKSDGRKIKVPEASYTFAPAHEKPFVQSIETSQELKQFLVGSDRAKSGSVVFEFWLNNGAVESQSYPISEVVKALRGKGNSAPSIAKAAANYLVRDREEIAKLKHGELKAYSEKRKAEIAEALRKAEEEKKRIEEEKKAAAAKALADAAAKAAKASTGAAAANVDRSKPTLAGGKVAIFFGSSTGNTGNVAELLKTQLGASVDHVKNISDVHPADFTVCESMILGIPTWHIGEMQDDWAAMLPEISALNFAGKKVAIFGLGDGKGYADTYVDAMAELLAPFEKTGAKLHGLWPTDGYEFKKSKAIRDGKFLGLVIDVENQDQLTEKRVKNWAQQLQKEMGI